MGTPLGVAATQSIGPAGGTISAAGDSIAVTIPAGAIDNATTFSIQEVTNTLYGCTNRATGTIKASFSYKLP